MRRSGLCLVLLATTGCPALAQTNCQLTGGFCQLQSQIPDTVGACQGPEQDRIELGEAPQPTTNGRIFYHSIDRVVSFSDGTQTWLLDPTGQGRRSMGPVHQHRSTVLAVEKFYAGLVNQIGGQCVSGAAGLHAGNRRLDGRCLAYFRAADFARRERYALDATAAAGDRLRGADRGRLRVARSLRRLLFAISTELFHHDVCVPDVRGNSTIRP
jgi:hypothetical protein